MDLGLFQARSIQSPGYIREQRHSSNPSIHLEITEQEDDH